MGLSAEYLFTRIIRIHWRMKTLVNLGMLERTTLCASHNISSYLEWQKSWHNLLLLDFLFSNFNLSPPLPQYYLVFTKCSLISGNTVWAQREDFKISLLQMNYEIFLLLFILLSRGLSTTHLKKACQVILSFFCSYSVFSLKIMNANAYLALEKSQLN